MKMSIQLTGCVLLSVLILILSSSFVTGEDKPGNPAYNWLNGKWYGRPPAGGELEMTLTVENGNQIRGQGLVPGGGRRSAVHPFITGAVNDDKVTLETRFPMSPSQSTVNYSCTFRENVLHCRTKGGYETTFKKLE